MLDSLPGETKPSLRTSGGLPLFVVLLRDENLLWKLVSIWGDYSPLIVCLATGVYAETAVGLSTLFDRWWKLVPVLLALNS